MSLRFLLTNGTEIKPKLCINCKFYIQDFYTTFLGSQYGKCSLFTTDEIDNYFLVNGMKKKVTNYYCSSARIYPCKKEGNFYQEK